MDLDNYVSEYMQNRNVLAMRIASIISLQLIIVVQFLVFKNVPVLIAFSLIIAIVGIYFVNRCSISRKSIPDDYSLRGSRDVLEYAYDIARDALIFNITCSFIVLLLGALIALFSSRIVFLIGMAAFVYMFYPSYDRYICYKQMLIKHLDDDAYVNKPLMIMFFGLLPIVTDVYLIWKYIILTKADIAWIVFCLFILVMGAAKVLITPFKENDE